MWQVWGEISHKDRGCYQESNQEVLKHMENVHISHVYGSVGFHKLNTFM